MKKTTIFMIAILVVFGGLVFYLLNKKSPDIQKTQLLENQEDIKTEDNSIKKLEDILAVKIDDSLELLDKAIEEGKIDPEIGLVYKVYAIFEDNKLPEEFISKTVNFNSNPVLYELQTKFSTLTLETQEKLAPFLKRPDEPDSYINQRYGQEDVTQNGLLFQTAKATRPNTNLYTEFFISTDNRVKLWYPNSDITISTEGGNSISISAQNAKAMAEKMKGYLDNDKIMQRYIDLLGKEIKKDGNRGGDDKLDIYVAPAGTSLAVTWGESATPCSSYIIMNIALVSEGDVLLKTVLAHEIFHSYQYAYKYDVVKDNWWGEATAVWAEDFIYPDANTEQARLSEFIPYPEVELFKEKPPALHHYAAYIFPYFITKKYGDDFMKKSWDGCDGKDCLESIDKIIEGGFKQQWREFTLWNYNKEPAKFYTDKKGFSDVSADSSESKEDFFIAGTIAEFTIAELKPLSARLGDAINSLEDESVKRIVFKDLKNFTGQSDKAAIKALIFYKNGKKEIEDWTEMSERSFCLENKDEDFDKVVLITSNADMKNKISKTNLKIEGKTSCYHISQNDKTSAVLYFPYANEGGLQTAVINTAVAVNSLGDTVTNAEEDQKYDYLTKWKLNYEFEQIRDAFTVSCGSSNVIFDAGWTSRNAGYLEFDLKLKDPNATEGTFGIDMTYGLPHPHGNYEDIPEVKANCISMYIDAMKLDLSGITGTLKNVYQGRIYDITEDGAKIEIKNSCLYDGCNMATGEPFQEMQPIILEIKK